MHAFPVKPRHIVVRNEHEKPMEHPTHLSPKAVHKAAHQRGGSPPKGAAGPLEGHRVEPEADEEDLGSHRLPDSDLKRIHSVNQHRIDSLEEGEAAEGEVAAVAVVE
jgi:hypothetical protein